MPIFSYPSFVEMHWQLLSKYFLFQFFVHFSINWKMLFHWSPVYMRLFIFDLQQNLLVQINCPLVFSFTGLDLFKARSLKIQRKNVSFQNIKCRIFIDILKYNWYSWPLIKSFILLSLSAFSSRSHQQDPLGPQIH